MEIFGFNLEEMVFWHWFAVAGIFLVLEVLTMGFFFLWFGASAILIGIIMLIFPEIAWSIQWSLWAIIALLDIAAWKIFMGKKFSEGLKTDEPLLNKRGEQYVGRTFTLEEAITNGFGKVKVDDSTWKVECEIDLDAGSKVTVKSVDGTVLQVEAFN